MLAVQRYFEVESVLKKRTKIRLKNLEVKIEQPSSVSKAAYEVLESSKSISVCFESNQLNFSKLSFGEVLSNFDEGNLKQNYPELIKLY